MGTKIDLTPAILDLNLYSGDGEDFQISFIDEVKTPIDVSRFTWLAQIRQLRTSIEAIDLSIDATKANVGILTIHISSIITKSLPKTSQWDLQNTSLTTEPRTVLQGTVTCNKDVTRSQVVIP